MLRITTIHDSSGAILKLDGSWQAPWTEEVRLVCAGLLEQANRPRLDLKDVSYIDLSGAKLLKTLLRDGFELTECSPFVSAVLATENV
ncbi:MAG TPA: hypothetical protein VMJ32_14815 [Pirellulales bacterium]|nr:hypothetical protein [Pirellulales bacterium]